MKQKTKQLQSSGETRKTNRTWHFLSTLNSLLLSKLLLLLIIPAIGSTAASAAVSYSGDAPATKTYAEKTFLDVINTTTNASISSTVKTFAIDMNNLVRTWQPAWVSITSGSCSNATGQTGTGFLATASGSNYDAYTQSYGYAKVNSGAYVDFYVTGITGIAIINKDNAAGSKYIQIQVAEVASDGTLGTVKTTSSNNTSVHVTEYAGSTLEASKYYKVTIIGVGTTTGMEVYQIRFTQGSATAYTVTFDAGSNGTCGTTSLKEAKAGAGVTLPTVTANEGYAFKGWYTAATDGDKVGDAGATYKPSADTPLYAQYDQLYNIATSAATGGTVTVDKSSATAGASVIVTASPSSNYVLDAIQVKKTSDDSDVTDDVLTGYTITMPAYDITVSATFNKVVESTATFTLNELKEFGGPSGGSHSTHQSYEHGGITLATSSNNVQGQGSGDGTKVRYTGTFTITPESGKKITEVTLVTKQSDRSLTASPATSEAVSRTSTTYTYKFNNVAEAITFTNNNSGNIYVTYITVKYTTEGSAIQTQLTGTFANDVMIYTNEVPVKPTLTVNADASNYTVSYASSNEDVVTVASDGTLSKVSDDEGGFKSGNAIITATLTPTAAGTTAGYIAGSASYTVAIYALRDLNITIPSVQMNSTDATQSNPTVTVYTTDGSGNTIELSSSEYTVAYTEVTDPNNIIASAGSTITVGGTAKNWNVGTATLRATITPSSSIISTYHVKATSYNFTYTVVDARVKWKPTIEYSSSIKVNVGGTLTVKPYVTYNGADITDGFTLSYSLDAGTAAGTTVDAGVITAGSTSGTATLTISAEPTDDYKEQYDDPDDFIVTITVAALKELDLSSIANQTVAVGNTINIPAYTVSDKETGTQLGDDEFTVAYHSSSPSIAHIDGETGMITGLADGTATITVFITKDGYKDGRITFNVTVKDDSTFKVSKSGSYKEFDILRNESGTLQVTLGGWNFPNEISNWNRYGTTTEKSSAKWEKATDGTKPAGYEALASGFGARNPRNENGSNCQPENEHIYDKTIAPQEFVLVDKMFNTPTSGSFLAFCPKVNGTVTARVRQSGCFEYYQDRLRYRPQRRVFIMDEAGNFVESTAKLEATTGSMPKATEESASKNGLNLLNYEYDLDTRSAGNGNNLGKIGNITEVLTLVNSHLGTTLTVDGEGKINNFSNGLYECQLGDEITHNNIAGRGSKSGAKGWVSLVNAPVSYTFNVKAGKTYYLYNFGAKIGMFGFSFKEGASAVDKIDYAQDVTSLTETAEGHVARVNINGLNVKGGQWNSLVLPFSLNQQQVEALFGECYKTGVADGTQILYYDKIENGKIKFVRHAYNNIVAGKPFLIKPQKTGNITINTADIVDFPYVTIESTSVADWGRSSEDYIWAGGYGELKINPGDYYINGSGNITFREKSTAKMHGFHGYLKDLKSDETKQGHSLVLDMLADFSLFDDDEATAIQELRMESDGTIREVPTSGKIYNMNGQLVGTNASKVYSLPAGMYIVNGKKYIVQ